MEQRNGCRRGLEPQPFRRFGGAIAWAEWGSVPATLRMIEALPDASPGAGSALLKLIIGICDEYGVMLVANVRPYVRDRASGDAIEVPIGEAPDRLHWLCRWYYRHGFDVIAGDGGTIEAWYPRQPLWQA